MILSLDVGTTVAKIVRFSREGEELQVAERAYPSFAGPGGSVTQDGGQIWAAVLEVLREIAAKIPGEGSPEALVLSSQGGSTLLCDEQGEPAAPVVTWLDRRADEIVRRWGEDGRAEIFRRRSGWYPQAGLPAAVLAWFREHRPEVIDRSCRVASIHDWLLKKLTGEWTTNPSCAAEMLLFSRKERCWDEELCALAGNIPLERLSTVASSFAVAGTLVADVSRDLGLKADLPVINGGQDHCCEAYALGMNDPGTALLACGTAWVVNIALADSGEGEVPGSMDLNFHIPEGRTIASRFLGGYGGTMEWWFRNFWRGDEVSSGPQRRDALKRMESEAALVDPGCNGLRFSPVGLSAGTISGIGLHHGRGAFTRALMEGVAFEVAEALAPLSGTALEPELLWMVGGAANSPSWPAIIAAVCAVPVKLFDYSHGPALGAAMIAAESLGWVSGHNEAMELFRVRGREILPPGGWKKAYRDMAGSLDEG
jgi:sugar (pentulose or hexulose) kinase